MITIRNSQGDSLEYDFGLFPGGEVRIKLNARDQKFFLTGSHEYKIVARLHNSNDVMTLLMAKNAILNIDRKAVISLLMPYVPYGRQDRVCDSGEAFSLKAFAEFINFLKFDQVVILDPHSDVTGAVFDNVKIIKQVEVIKKNAELNARILEGGPKLSFIAPDKGSTKRVEELARLYGHTDYIQAHKDRDLTNGRIKEYIVYADDLKGQDILIPDDICDGGATFVSLAKILRQKNAGKILLYVTHGIFSKNFRDLFEAGIDEIWTTDSFKANFVGYLPEPPKLNIFKLETYSW